MQSDDDDFLRQNLQVRELSSEYINNSQGQDANSATPYQNELAMLDENYTGGNFDGGFNGYNSMQKGEYF